MNAYFNRGASLLTCAFRYWNSDNASTTGAALAFYCAFSLAPLLVIILTTAGWVVGVTAAYSQLNGQLIALFGPAYRASIWMEGTRQSRW